ncbi:hypothetical protein NQ317_006742 [Molorchus minor]|uniref:Uncharacterized protein n=1 Tax=Molorchus minor TaxID=1323400 RepID=A0ABQ9IRA2_9CUCU|nr:hypothetical protein NQ317_006742 [Molorchus minor]
MHRCCLYFRIKISELNNIKPELDRKYLRRNDIQNILEVKINSTLDNTTNNKCN